MLAFLFLALAIVVRFLPHVFHVTPVGAALLYFGAKQPKRNLAVAIAALVASDLALNRFVYHFPISLVTISSALWYALYIAIGRLVITRRETALRVASGSLAGATTFFLVSNFIAWLSMPAYYARSWSGLVQSYTMALPFFDKTLASDIFFSAAMFGAPALIAYLRRDRVPVVAMQ